jgi:hypothetical protein
MERNEVYASEQSTRLLARLDQVLDSFMASMTHAVRTLGAPDQEFKEFMWKVLREFSFYGKFWDEALRHHFGIAQKTEPVITGKS